MAVARAYVPLAVTLPDWLARRAETHSNAVAVECGDEQLTYRQLDARAGSVSAALLDLGLREGERVALLLANSMDFAVFVHAVPRAGGVLTLINARLTPGEIAWQLRDASARFLVTDAEYGGLATEAAALPDADGIPVLVVTDARWTALAPLSGGDDIPLDRPHTVIYTSGTTGRPKGAVLTHGNFYWSAVGSAGNLGVRADDRWLACLPLYHVGGLSILLRSAIYGTAAVIHERFDAERAVRALREQRVSLLSVVAVILERMLALDGEGFPPSLHAVLLGGGPAPRPLLEAAVARGVPVLQTYGLSESTSQVATLSSEDALRKLGSAGLPLAGTTVRVEVDGRVAEPHEVGEILVSGPTVCAGYLNRPDATADAIRDGWLHTGDLGYLDEEGYLYIADRRDDLIVTGGENVYPAEVESALLGHPGVGECVVVGIPDERWGANVVAVVLAAMPGVDATALEAHARAQLAGYKVPRRFVFVDEPLPRTASGKLQRHLVREQLMERAEG